MKFPGVSRAPERRLGEMLAKMPKAKGSAGTGRPTLGGTKAEPPKCETTLADLGIDKKMSAARPRNRSKSKGAAG